MDYRTYQQFRTYCREDLKDWTDLPGYAEVAHLWWKLKGQVGVIKREAQVADNLHQCSNLTPRQRAAAELLSVISNHRIISWLRESEPPKGYEREEPLSPEDADAIAKQTIASVARYAAFLPEREAAVLLADCKTFAAATSGTPEKAAPPVSVVTPALADDGGWEANAWRLADEIGMKKWSRGERQFSVRSICEPVAAELGKGTTNNPTVWWGTQGPRSAGAIRTALKGWQFTPPNTGTNGTSCTEQNQQSLFHMQRRLNPVIARN